MNKIDRQAITDIRTDKQITNMAIVTYLSATAMSKLDKETEYPTIKNFTIYALYKNMKDKMYWINKSSVEKAFKKLVELGYFTYIDGNLAIFNGGAGHMKSDQHFKSEGYITLHHFFFNKVFFDLSLRSKKLALYFVSRLNNDASKEEKVNLKSRKDPETFEKWCTKLKVNRLAHIKTTLKELKGLFNITELKNNNIAFSLNTLSKAALTGTDKLFTYTKEQIQKVTKLLKEVNDKNLDFKENDIKEITEAIKDNSIRFNRKVLQELCKNSRDNVKNLLGYTKNIAKRLRTAQL